MEWPLFILYIQYVVKADSGRLNYDQVYISLLIIIDIVIQPAATPGGINIFLNLG